MVLNLVVSLGGGLAPLFGSFTIGLLFLPIQRNLLDKLILLSRGWGGRHSTMDSILTSHPAGPGSNHGTGDFFPSKKNFSDVAELIDSMHCLE